ncbi:ExbD/TolR family protein [Ramlibacter sp. MAHUQ-53]|uniref:ExbD/TolR family protein n=1 Tax=unclassified Ramlibacter TaxID=2617605 RepID=UPI0036382FD0
MSFGRLERTPPPQPFSDINVTPLVDVMLVLVVIFIVTAPLLANSIRLDLPKAAAAKPREAGVAITVVLDPQGGLFIDRDPVTPAQLAERLAQAGKLNPATEVQLRADQSVPYGRVVEVMGAAQAAGLNRVGFVAESPAR